MNIRPGLKTGKRRIQSGEEYDHLFPRAEGGFISVKKEAKVEDTIKLLKWVIRNTLDDTKQIAKRLQGASVFLTCKNVWEFCFNHFQYELDEFRKEQIRRPARSWRDRNPPRQDQNQNNVFAKGIDCDCLTVLIGSILTNLGIPFKLRITRYEAVGFEHIYPVAWTPDNVEIVMDCVVHEFNYEVPYNEKRDYYMELQYLNGVDGERFNEFGDTVRFQHNLPIDAEDLFLDEMEFQGLGASAKKVARKAEKAEKKEERKEERQEKKAERKADPTPLKEKVKEGLKKGVNAVNKVNPAAVLLRAGMLAGMKLNLFHGLASTLRFAYWSKEQAEMNEMDMAKYAQLVQLREKVEKIYFTAGGNNAVLREAILTGKGNQDKMVQLNGLGSVIPAVRDEDSLKTILGEHLFSQELSGFGNLNGYGSLGAVVATTAAVAAASGVLATISNLIKKVGSVFKKGTAASQKVLIKSNTDAVDESTRKFSVKNIVNKVKTKIQERRENKALKEGTDAENFDTAETTSSSSSDASYDYGDEDPEMPDSYNDSANEVATDDTAYTDDTTVVDTRSDIVTTDPKSGEKTGLIAWFKENPGKTTGIAIGVAALVGGYFLYKRSKAKKEKEKSKASETQMNGFKGKAGNKKNKKNKSGKKNKIALERLELL